MVRSHIEFQQYGNRNYPSIKLVTEEKTFILHGLPDHEVLLTEIEHPKSSDISILNDFTPVEACVTHMNRDEAYDKLWEVIRSLNDYSEISSPFMDFQYKLNTFN